MGGCCQIWGGEEESYEREKTITDFSGFITGIDSTDDSFYISQDNLVTQFSDFSLSKRWETVDDIRHISVDALVLCSSMNIEAFSLEGQQQFCLRGHEKGINSVIQKEGRAVSGSRDWTTRVWDLNTQQELSKTLINWNVITSMSWIPDSFNFVQTSEDLHIRIWDLRQAKVCETVQVGSSIATCCHTGKYIATGHRGFDPSSCYAKLWDLRNLKEGKTLVEHQESVTAVKWKHSQLVTVGRDGSACFYDDEGVLLSTQDGYQPIEKMCLHKKGVLIVTNTPEIKFLAVKN